MTSTVQQKMPEIIAVDEATLDEVKSLIRFERNFVWVGPERYFMQDGYSTFREQVFNFALRPDDIFLISLPRSGSTWTQEMIWLLNNNLDYDTARKVHMDVRFPLLDLAFSVTDETVSEWLDQVSSEQNKANILNIYKPSFDRLNLTPSPRFFKSHSPLSLLPPNLLDTVKVVYVVRDPRDVAVSFYHLLKLRFLKDNCDFKMYWSLFRRGLLNWTPIFPHIKEAWKMRYHPNMIFLHYEEIKMDLPGTLRRLSEFFGKTYTDKEIDGLCKHLEFKEFKKNPSVNHNDLLRELGIVDDEHSFIRKGEVGGWRDYFIGDLEAESNNWMQENLKDTDFQFVTFNQHSKN